MTHEDLLPCRVAVQHLCIYFFLVCAFHGNKMTIVTYSIYIGERPFSCKVCNMSFTTNGNMHRHSRIHAKDGSGSPSLKDAPSRGSSGKKSDDQMSIGSSSSSRKRALEINAASMTTTKRRLYDDEAGHIRYPIQQPPGPMMPGAMFGAQPFPTIGWPMDVPMDVPKEANVPKKPEPVRNDYHIVLKNLGI